MAGELVPVPKPADGVNLPARTPAAAVTTTQSWNHVRGDQAARDINKITNNYAAQKFTAMTRVIQEYLAEQQQDARLDSAIAKVEHYLTKPAEHDVRGLDQKLTSAGRTKELQIATLKKHRATQFIMLHQSSPAAQKIIGFLLAKILTAFESHVAPLIEQGAAPEVVDAAIHTQVLEPAWEFLELNPLEIDHTLLSGLVYFLGGNCHLRWDHADLQPST